MKKIILLLLSIFALNVTGMYAQELTKEEQNEQAMKREAAEEVAKKAEKERSYQAKKQARREAQFTKFVEMVNNYKPTTHDTKNIAELDTFVKHLDSLMVDVIELFEAYQSVEMVSEPYVGEDGVTDTLWYARDKATQKRFSNEEAEKLLKSQKTTLAQYNIRLTELATEAGGVGTAVVSAPGLSDMDKLALGREVRVLVKQAELIKYGLTSMNCYLRKNMEYLGSRQASSRRDPN